MGQYLSVSLAKTIYMQKNSKEESFENVKESLSSLFDLSLYDINNESDYFVLEMKKEPFQKEIVNLMCEICESITFAEKEYMQKIIEDIKSKNYKQIMEMAERNSMYFRYGKGSHVSNDISYLLNNHRGFCDTIDFIYDGKIFMECYNNIFYYLRNSIIKGIKNPLGKSIVVTMIG